MARDDIFQVRHNSIPAIGESNPERAIINRMGMQIVSDFITQMTLSGFAYHMQLGTEDAGANSTTAMDDQLASICCDNIVGQAMIPLLYEVTPGVLATATIVQAMLELDKDKVRYTSGGTAFVPANLRGDDYNAASGVGFYVGPDVTIAAKSAVPNSVELARKFFIEDTITDSLGYPGAWDPLVYSARLRPIAVLIDASSIIGHFGAATADVVGYAVLQFAQFSKSLIV
jgi:hypothetical protein